MEQRSSVWASARYSVYETSESVIGTKVDTLKEDQRRTGIFPWLNSKIIIAHLVVFTLAISATATLVVKEHTQVWQNSVKAGLDLVGPDIHQAIFEQDQAHLHAILAALHQAVPFSVVEISFPEGSQFRYPESSNSYQVHRLFNAQWLALWPYNYTPESGQFNIKVNPDPEMLEQSIYNELMSLALILVGLFAAMLGIYGLHWQWSVQRPLQLVLSQTQRVNLERPLRYLLHFEGRTSVIQELDSITSYINELLLVIDGQQQNRRQAEEQLKAHQRNLSKIVQARTAELVELNKKFIQQQFDAKTSALEAKQARWDAEKANQDKTRFLAAASHDLRQPLHAMSLFVEALESQLTSHSAMSIHKNLKRSLETMKELFHALLDISKLEAGVLQANFEHFPVQRIFERLEVVYRQQAIEKHLDLRIAISNYTLHSDPHLLEQVISNLVSNAIKYTDTGYVLVGCKRSGDTIRFMVWDSGSGIPQDEHRSIFKEFVQLVNPERDRSKGLGLGLSIVKRICLLLGHEVRFQSSPGKGTRFEILVPIGKATAPTLQMPSLTQSALHLQKVLVIDDDATILLGMKALLESWNLKPLLARSIEDALRVCQNRQLRPDLIISDLRLENGITGIQAIRRMHGHFASNIPAILITGDTSPDRIQMAYESPYPLLHKPIKPAQLRSVCTSVLELAPSGSTALPRTHRV